MVRLKLLGHPAEVSQVRAGLVLGTLGVVLFSLTLPVTRLAIVLGDLSPLAVTLIRLDVAIVLSVLLLLMARARLPALSMLPDLLAVAAGAVIGFPLLMAYALALIPADQSPASHAIVVSGLLPLVTAVAATVLCGDRPSLGFWGVAVTGSACVVGYAIAQGGGAVGLGDVAMVGAVISAATGYACGSRLSARMPSWQVICWAAILTTPLAVPLTLALPPLPAAAWQPESLLTLVYLGAISQVVGFFAWYRGLALGGTARVSQVQLLQPFLSLIAAAVLLNEVLTPLTLTMTVVVAGLVMLGRRMPVRRLARQAAPMAQTAE